MIREFTDRFVEKQGKLLEKYSAKHPEDYKEIVQDVVRLITDDSYGAPDPDKVVEINHGHYQGTLLYVFPDTSYQPDEYWFVMVDYGSCSVCDTLERIRSHDWGDTPTEQQAKDYLTLALHVAQGIKKLEGEAV